MVNQKAMNLCYLISLLLGAFLTAALAHFVQMCIEPGEVFGRYGVWLNYLWIKSRAKNHKKRKWWGYLLKPLGLCVYCNGTWIALFVYIGLFYNRNTGVLPQVIGLFLFMGVNYIWIKILSKL